MNISGSDRTNTGFFFLLSDMRSTDRSNYDLNQFPRVLSIIFYIIDRNRNISRSFFQYFGVSIKPVFRRYKTKNGAKTQINGYASFLFVFQLSNNW